jgi:SRSO17 transposase
MPTRDPDVAEANYNNIFKGEKSAGVARRYCGPKGKTDNCQAGVFIGFSGAKDYGLLDGRL